MNQPDDIIRSEAERRRREVRKVMRDDKTRDVEKMWIALDEQRDFGHHLRWELAELQSTVDELVELGHLVVRRQPESHFEGKPFELAPVYVITEAGRDFDG